MWLIFELWKRYGGKQRLGQFFCNHWQYDTRQCDKDLFYLSFDEAYLTIKDLIEKLQWSDKEIMKRYED